MIGSAGGERRGRWPVRAVANGWRLLGGGGGVGESRAGVVRSGFFFLNGGQG